LRKLLESTIIAARDLAEQAASAVLGTLAITQREAFATMTPEQRRLRAALRAKAAQLGETTITNGGVEKGLSLLIHEIAYEQWHRMLFARFLAENHLLMHPAGVAVSLQDCADLAREEGASDGWELAARYAGLMLPGLFIAGDPAVQVRFAPEHRHGLERLVQALPSLVFTADDSLGWVYQFWQTQRKKAVNESGEKIGGANLGPVTQLFTEDYMVKFLLHNSLGAWWAARHPDSPLIAGYDYLRWADEAETDSHNSPNTSSHPERSEGSLSPLPRTPAAGTFPGWPDRVAEVTVMDPCGGSGHFVMAAFEMLVPMRMAEEGLSEAEAVTATIRDNLFMLELDDRCCQIAAFNLMLAAWKRTGYRADLPLPNIACSGIAVEGQLSDWLKLAKEETRLQHALTRLYELFRQAPTLGSLINPATALQDGLFSVDYAEVAPLLDRALAREQGDDPAAAVVGQAAQGVLRAAVYAGHYQCALFGAGQTGGRPA
jgi:hypothetical protein